MCEVIKNFLIWITFKVYWICYNIASVLYSGFSAWKHVESLLPNQGLNLQPPVLEGEVLTTGPPGKSLFYLNFFCCVGLTTGTGWLSKLLGLSAFPGSLVQGATEHRGDWNRVFFPEAWVWGRTLWGHTLSEASAAPFRGLLCAYMSLADCAFLRHQHAEHSGRSPASHLLGQSQNGLQDSKTIRLFLLFFSALSSLFCISTVSLSFFSFFFSSPGFCSKDSGSLGTGPVYKDPSPFFSFLHYCLWVLHQKKNPCAKLVKTYLSLQRGRKRDTDRPNNNDVNWMGRRGRLEWILPLL